ncbi:MAG: ester cyclase [Caldilineaceae bacterium]|nr:ester cyclase [Caldilineaceae bacterium]
MPTEANKQIIRRIYEEIINQERKAVIDELYSDDVIIHDPFTGTSQGIDALKGLLAMFDAAFPHHRVELEGLFAEGDYVAALHTHVATNNGSFLGRPPTGRSIRVNGLELFRLQHGRIVEFWRKDDDASMLIQLGMLPMEQPS